MGRSLRWALSRRCTSLSPQRRTWKARSRKNTMCAASSRHARKTPAAPIPKLEAFEDFKSERESEINRILKENKSVLEKRKKAKELMDINYTKQALLAKKQDLQLQGESVSGTTCKLNFGTCIVTMVDCIKYNCCISLTRM